MPNTAPNAQRLGAASNARPATHHRPPTPHNQRCRRHVPHVRGESRHPSLRTRMAESSTTARERIPTTVVDDPHDLAIQVARRIADLIREHGRAGRPTVLGLATGSTPVDVYAELVRL